MNWSAIIPEICLILPYQFNPMDELLQKANELTPIEEYDGIFYKRDDLFRPFPGEALNGGKLRQAINLISHNLDLIRSDYNGKVATTGSVDSPQGLIISRVALYYNLKCFVAYGNIGDEALITNNFIRHTRHFGGEVKSILGIAFDNRLMPKLLELQQEGKGNNFFPIKFGIDIEKNACGIDCIAAQVKNIPDDVIHLVIPAGSGISAGAILRGIQKFNKQHIKIHIVHVSGKDRKETIDKITPNFDYHYEADTTYGNHHQRLRRMVTENFYLDEIYEAKAYEWMLKHIYYDSEKTLFWVVGNANFYR